MKYEEFKAEILAGLRKICGDHAVIRIERILKNNGKHYDGIQIGQRSNLCATVSLEWFYEVYCDGAMSIEGCILSIYKISEEGRNKRDVLELVSKAMDWEQIKGKIYPILLSTKLNQEMLEKVVSKPMMDLSVAYIAREAMDGQYVSIKINRAMLQSYSISAEELHEQALKNLESDGYQFRDILHFVQSFEHDAVDGLDIENTAQNVEMYILTNAVKSYGAAGILDKKLIKEFAAGRDFFILPSSIHETIFVPADDMDDGEAYNCMVKMVNKEEVDIEEQLSDHAYFYDAVADEIRVCA